MTLVNDLRLQFSTELMSDAPPRKGRSVTTAAGPYRAFRVLDSLGTQLGMLYFQVTRVICGALLL